VEERGIHVDFTGASCKGVSFGRLWNTAASRIFHRIWKP